MHIDNKNIKGKEIGKRLSQTTLNRHGTGNMKH